MIGPLPWGVRRHPRVAHRAHFLVPAAPLNGSGTPPLSLILVQRRFDAACVRRRLNARCRLRGIQVSHPALQALRPHSLQVQQIESGRRWLRCCRGARPVCLGLLDGPTLLAQSAPGSARGAGWLLVFAACVAQNRGDVQSDRAHGAGVGERLSRSARWRRRDPSRSGARAGRRSSTAGGAPRAGRVTGVAVTASCPERRAARGSRR
jgi:hypothetical protein